MGDTENAERARILKFHYLKSVHFRVVHVDGITGGIAPRGGIQMAVFNERAPIPQQVTHEFTPQNTLGPEDVTKRVVRDGVVREVEVNLMMGLEIAKSIRDWLTEQIRQLEQLQEARK